MLTHPTASLDDTRHLETLRDFLRWAMSRFAEQKIFLGHGTDNYLDEAAWLILQSLHLPADLDERWFDARLTPSEAELLHERIRRRCIERIPTAYLTGQAWFMGLPFQVNPHVLIPRSPTAELIENAFTPWIDPARVERILDLCTGSGCIGIASASVFPDVQVDLADISPEALDVARTNIALHGMEGRVRAIESDLFDALQGQRYDIIISNPPYVDARDMRELPPEYRHEPRLALEAGEDGMRIVNRILAQAAAHLNPGGLLVVEVGNTEHTVAERHPELPLVWLEFQRGGDGVFLITREDLPNVEPAP